MKVLVLGATGMIGHAALDRLAHTPGVEAIGAVRDAAALAHLPARLACHARIGGDLVHPAAIGALLDAERPDVILNAAGLVKQPTVADPCGAIRLNARFPHRLARAAATRDIRLIHISTDCVFAGTRGGYREADAPDARDLYGRSKRIGEPRAPALTLRTALIGPELGGARGLFEWFIGARGPVPGYACAIFSGLTTQEFARFVCGHVLPRPDLKGLYHLSAAPIAKHDLLRLIAARWPHPIEIRPIDTPAIDRSLDSSRLRAQTGWVPPSWPQMIDELRSAS